MKHNAPNPYELPDYDHEFFDDPDMYGDDVFDFEARDCEEACRRAEAEINDFNLMERNG